MNVSSKYYSEVNAYQKCHSNELIDRIVKDNFQIEFSNVIDIGCGCGNVTHNLFECIKPQSLFGINNDPEMIEFAAKNYSAPQIHYEIQDFGVPFYRMNDAIKELKGKASLIFSNKCLHWIRDTEAVTKNIEQLLSDNGKLYANICINFLTDAEKSKFGKYIKVPTKSEQCQRWRNAFKTAEITIICENITEFPLIYTKEHFRKVLVPFIINITKNYIVEDDPQKREYIYNEYKYLMETNTDMFYKHIPNSGSNSETMVHDKDILYQIVAEKSKIN